MIELKELDKQKLKEQLRDISAMGYISGVKVGTLIIKACNNDVSTVRNGAYNKIFQEMRESVTDKYKVFDGKSTRYYYRTAAVLFNLKQQKDFGSRYIDKDKVNSLIELDKGGGGLW